MFTYDETDMDDARVSIFGTTKYALPYGGTFTRGDYSTSDLLAHHVAGPGQTWDGKGIRVPSGLVAEVFSEDSFGGTSQKLTGPTTKDSMSGQIASLRVYPTDYFEISATWIKIPYSPFLTLASISKQLITNPETDSA